MRESGAMHRASPSPPPRSNTASICAASDVGDDASVDAAIDRVIADNGRLDIVVHNAGHMVFGPAEAFARTAGAALRRQRRVDPAREPRGAAAPARRQRRGLLVWVSSSSARGGTPPFLAPYFAAKAAMDSLAVSYAAELAAGASKRRSSCRARSPGARITSSMRASRPIPPCRPPTTAGRTRVSPIRR
jgi:NAD(P)-dependent dehydrogenase (short-subunit alcohol dehydrogenase family)